MAVGTPDTKDEADKAYSPETRKAEGASKTPEDIVPGGSLSSADSAAFDQITAGINNQDKADSFVNNVTGNNKAQGTAKGKRKKGPMALLIAVLGGGAVAGGIFASMSILPLHLMESLADKFNMQDTSFSRRTSLILNKKISGDITSGCSGVVKLLCRYERPSNRLLSNLEKQGITAVDSDGKPITKKTFFPNQKPAGYKMEGVVGSGKDGAITAKEFSKVLNSNPTFRGAVKAAYNPKFMALSSADPVMQKIKKVFGFNSKDKLKNTTSTEDLNKTLNEQSAGTNKTLTETAKQAGNAEAEADAVDEVEKNLEGSEPTKTDSEVKAGGGPEKTSDATAAKATSMLEKLFGDKIANLLKKLAGSGKGGLVGLGLSMGCMATDIPGIITGVTWAYQNAQLVRFGATLFMAINALKAGDASSGEVSALGDYFTATNSDGKSALDSLGMQNVLYGSSDTSKTGDAYKNYIPGYAAATALGGVVGVFNSAATKTACKTINNPVTQATIQGTVDAVSSETIIVPIINAIGGIALAEVITWITPLVAPMIASWVAPMFQNILAWMMGDFTADIPAGPARGDAVASATASLLSAPSTGGGNQALTVSQELAYENIAKQQQIADAEVDRATLSPFDTSSQYTFLGSLVNKMLPYYSQLGSITGSLSFIANILPMSVGSLLNTFVSADNNSAQWQMCDETNITEAQSYVGGDDSDPIAAGPFCNIATGIPAQYLDDDPEEVANRMIGYGAINDETGVAVPDNEYLKTLTGDVGTISYASWLDQCTDPTSNDEIGACMINNQQVADYALYTIDQRVMDTMDGDGTEISNDPDAAYTDIPSNQIADNYGSALAMMGEYLTDGNVDSPTNTSTAIATTTQPQPTSTISLSDIIKIMPQPAYNSFDNLASMRLETPLWV